MPTVGKLTIDLEAGTYQYTSALDKAGADAKRAADLLSDPALTQGLPVVLGLDDIQWVDEATARWLEYIAPRLLEMRVLLLLTAREGELAARDTIARALSASVELERVRLAELSESAVAEVLAQLQGFPAAAGA